MIKEAIGTGDTIEEAKENALTMLDIDTDDYEIEVLQMPEKKKFGLFGGSQAKVKITVTIIISPVQKVENYLTDVLNKMGVTNIEIKVSEENNDITVDISGDDYGVVIGKRGETLSSLQYLCGLVANQGVEHYKKVTINVGDYRERREATLNSLGRSIALKVIKTRKNFSLEPMNPYERRVIHTAVQKINGAKSWSEGENARRHVVIGVDNSYKGKKREYNNNKPRRNSYNNKYSENKGKKENIESKNDVEELSLYGKIEF